MRALLAVTLLAGICFGLVSTADADISKKVQAAFKGKLLISDAPLPDSAGDDKATIAAYNKAVIKEVKGEPGDEVTSWRFNFTAFLTKAPGKADLSLDFYNASKEYVANKRLTVTDGSLTVISGEISFDENDNVNPNTTYTLQLTGKVKGKEVVFASAMLSMK
jgi:hypothetical protein